AEKRRALSALAPDPIEVSAAQGTNVDALGDRVHEALPQRRSERLVLPMTEGTMSLVSWVHDHAYVEEEDYSDGQVTLSFEAIPSVIERARARASDLVPAAESV
ncbi:MAG: GTPase HflX, partial [Halobacteriales archaeon]|nr:GTPase HflX [Halobacteriales archaeon]